MPVYNWHYWPIQGQIGTADILRAGGPLLPVEVAVPDALAQYLTQQGQAVPAPVIGVALIDTGASVTAVHQDVFTSLAVSAVGSATVGSANGPSQKPTFPAKISFPGTQLQGIGFNQVLSCDLTGQLVNGQQVIVLMGRDLLQHFILIYNGPGGTIALCH